MAQDGKVSQYAELECILTDTFPGLLHLKTIQDSTRSASDMYIRYAQEYHLPRKPDDDEDIQLLGQVSDPNLFRLVICIKSKNSFRLTNEARRIQSDISFKIFSGWLEFELGGFDRVNK